MLTGGLSGMASAAAAKINILPNMKMVSKDIADSIVMTVKQFDELSDERVDQSPFLPLVIARCAPNTKFRMIEAHH